MKKIDLHTESKRMLADVYTPVSIYLRLRDRFRDTILLESTDAHVAENSYSFICINAIGGIEVKDAKTIEIKYPNQDPIKQEADQIDNQLWGYMQGYQVVPHTHKETNFAQGLFGYTSFDAIPLFETISFADTKKTNIPLIRYRLYQYVIVFDHYKDELFICQNLLANEQADTSLIESLIRNKDVPQFPFTPVGDERSNVSDEAYTAMVEKGIQHCLRGDVFQIVLSRRFEQSFKGDEFNVYRALRSVNPSPYLFFFDYGDYKLMGSSPEAQLIVRNNKAVMHPIAGTFKRTGNDEEDKALSVKLLEDAKENAEHVMLVDLARNDLSRSCTAVTVSQFKQVKFYSHVIHLVSEVVGTLGDAANPFNVLAQTFPAGTLSGAPKFKSLEIIDGLEPTARGYYGGAIGFVGFNGDFNHAIMIRSFLSKDNTLYYQAGAGVVVSSNPESELQEVNNKLNALKKAVVLAAGI
ncbi:MAG: anthranilate synthase component I family protein [Bacteroidetes bacterium]|nr:anthranilate synthase component I family protein [Bacteroidota bacterium]